MVSLTEVCMGKAYSSDERSDIKIRIMEAALDLYHENGAKTLNVREIVKRVGISLGSFYNFWPDKDSLVLDVMKYRAAQKLEAITPRFKESLDDPIGFLTELICSWVIDMKEKFDSKPIYREGITFLLSSQDKGTDRFLSLYSEFLNDLSGYWINAGVIRSFDITGVTNMIISTSILLCNSSQLKDVYFEAIVKDLVSSSLKRYIEVKE